MAAPAELAVRKMLATPSRENGPLRRLLIANRGALVPRIARTARALGIETVAICSDADAGRASLGVADQVVPIGGNRPADSYLRIDAILHAAEQSGADAIHPGYGFLAESAAFARQVRNAGRIFVGPNADAIARLGNKVAAKQAMAQSGLPVSPTLSIAEGDGADVAARAQAMGLPLLIKPSNGGGGIGMTAVRAIEELGPALERASQLARNSFGDGEIFVERLLERPRHIEFQIASDGHRAVHLFERDCSVQRRFQKILEESPAPSLGRAELDAMAQIAADAMLAVGYDQIGTVEMLYQPDVGFQFLEVNARLQVEHGITEAVTGIDLVACQLRLARGERLDEVILPRTGPVGHAIEARICAEDPATFFPSAGRLNCFQLPASAEVRIETGYAEGEMVTPYYDSLLAKIIVHRADREKCVEAMIAALGEVQIAGVKTNIPFILKLLQSRDFRDAQLHTGLAQQVNF